MKRALIFFLTLVAATAQSVTLPRGKEQLRQLAVVPQLTMSFRLGVQDATFLEDLTEEGTIEDWKERARKKLQSEPDDLQTQLQLGRWLNVTDDTNAACGYLEKVVAASRRRSEQRPTDGGNLTVLAGALGELGKVDEAESLYRRATTVASNEWRCWTELGKFLDNRSFSSMTSGGSTNRSKETNFAEQLLKQPPVPEEMEKAVKLRDEASGCFQRAFAIAPKEFEVLVLRGRHLSFSNWTATMIQHHREETRLAAESVLFVMVGMFFSPLAAPEYQRALEMRPDCYRLLTLMAYSELVSAMKTFPRSDSTQRPTLERLSEKSQKVVLQVMERLKTLGRSSDKKIAAGALTSLCGLKTMLGDEGDQVADLQRAVELDQTNEQAWDLLIINLLGAGSQEQLLEVCERRLKSRDSARNHLILAKALCRQKLYEKAEIQTEKALGHEENYVPAGIMMVVLGIKKEVDPGAIAGRFEQLRKQIDGLADVEEKKSRYREFMLNAAIVCGLADENEEAKNLLKMLLKADSEDEDARNILNALP